MPRAATTTIEGEAVRVDPEAAAPTNGLLSRDAILAADDVLYEYMDIPEWGGRIRVRSLSGRDRDAYDAEAYALSQASPNDPSAALRDYRSRRVARAIVDEDGKRVFSKADVDALSSKNASVIDRIDDVVTRLSGMDTEAIRRAAEALKAVQSAVSGSD